MMGLGLLSQEINGFNESVFTSRGLCKLGKIMITCLSESIWSNYKKIHVNGSNINC